MDKMTDRELLELAAKAAGLSYTKPAEGYGGAFWLDVGENPMRTQLWNPLSDDEDAHRLAVDLMLSVEHIEGQDDFFACVASPDEKIVVNQDYEDDKYAATRRAIVLAAAEIGRDV